MRGSLYGPDDAAIGASFGFEAIDGDGLVALPAHEYGARVRNRVGDAPAFLSFDVDVVDPAFAPATGTPETGGLTSREALAYLRSLAGIQFVGFDVVEVSPPYDGPGQPTAVLAAGIAFEMLALDVLRRG
jgi:agmatinase